MVEQCMEIPATACHQSLLLSTTINKHYNNYMVQPRGNVALARNIFQGPSLQHSMLTLAI